MRRSPSGVVRAKGSDGLLWAPDSRVLAARRSVEQGNHDGVVGWFVSRVAEGERYGRFELSVLIAELQRRGLPPLRLPPR